MPHHLPSCCRCTVHHSPPPPHAQAVVEEVNSQFRDPDLTTFVCVCIPEFLSLYETERLVQELARFGIDARNIAINQVIFPDEVGRSRLLAARARMQQKYLDQFYDLYEDFHIVKMPLLEEEVRGVDALREFSRWLVEPYAGRGGDADGGDGGGGGDGAEALEAEAARLRRRLAEVEAALGAL
jgi:arsenite-transporting ATPase